MIPVPFAARAADGHDRSRLPVIAVILAGGTGTRAGTNVPKQFVRVAGRPVVEHTIAAFADHGGVDGIVVVRPAEHAARMDVVLEASARHKVIAVVNGGADRMGSTAAALAALTDLGLAECKLLVHDGVRPLVDERIITDCILGLDHLDALDVVVPAVDTIVEVSPGGDVVDIPRRSTLRRGQTPQAFLKSILERAYHLALPEPTLAVTDDCAVVRQCCPEVRIGTVRGSEDNIKVTHPQDFLLLDQLFRMRTMPIGQVDGRLAALRGATVVVMGGTRGIGAAIVDALREVGAHAVVPRRDEGFEVSDVDSVTGVLADAELAYGSIDAVVVTAGVLEPGRTADVPLETLRSVLRTNIWGPVVVAQAAHPFLARSGGQLLLFGSSSYTRGRSGYGVYSASKAAVANLTQALAEEWHQDGIRVNCISPARTDTDMRRDASLLDADVRAAVLTPQTVAQASLRVLASRASGSIVDVSPRTDPVVRIDVDATVDVATLPDIPCAVGSPSLPRSPADGF